MNNMKERFVPVASPVIGDMEIEFVTDAVKSTWVSSIGPYIDRFEREFANYVGVPNAVAVSNGTIGLHLALHSLGIGPGDEVIVPDLTFVATAHAVLQTGAQPVFVDVEPDTWCMDPVAVARAVTPHTKAIIPVHLYGHPVDMPGIQAVVDEHNLIVVEDAAEAHGAEVNGRRVGSMSSAGVFSFYGNKIITTGEGGMITTSDDDLAVRLRFLRDHGMDSARRYYHTELAFNYRITNLQAALGVAQMLRIEEFIAKKRMISQWYQDALSEMPGIQFHVERPWARNVYWLACIVLTDDFPLSRQALVKALRQVGIDTRPFFVPMHELPHLVGFRQVGREGNTCLHATRLGRQGLNLPSSCNLDEDTVHWICEEFKRL